MRSGGEEMIHGLGCLLGLMAGRAAVYAAAGLKTWLAGRRHTMQVPHRGTTAAPLGPLHPHQQGSCNKLLQQSIGSPNGAHTHDCAHLHGLQQEAQGLLHGVRKCRWLRAVQDGAVSKGGRLAQAPVGRAGVLADVGGDEGHDLWARHGAHGAMWRVRVCILHTAAAPFVPQQAQSLQP